MFDFRSTTNKENQVQLEMVVTINGERFNKNANYGRVKSLRFENQFGRVDLIGNYELPSDNNRVPEVVRIYKNAVVFDNDFAAKNSNTSMFIKKDITCTFTNHKLPLQSKETLEELKYKAEELNANIEIVEGYLRVSLEKIQNVDLRPAGRGALHLMGENVDNVNKSGGFFMSAMDVGLPGAERNKPSKRIRDEFGINRSYEENLQDMEDLHIRVAKSKEVSVIEDKGGVLISPSINSFEPFHISCNFESEGLLDLYTEVEKREGISLNDPYHTSGGRLTVESKLKKYRKSFHSYGMKPCFNQKGELITLGKFNNNTFRHHLVVHKVTPNKNLTIKIGSESPLSDYFFLHSYYHKNTFQNYLRLLNSRLEALIKGNTNPRSIEGNLPLGLPITIDNLGVNDYTSILNEYLSDLGKYIEGVRTLHLNESVISVSHDQEIKEIKGRVCGNMQGEMGILKLFGILFLNSYSIGRNSSQSSLGTTNQVESIREEVKRMRKKKLVEWLIESTNKKYILNYDRIMKTPHIPNTTLNYKLILHCLLYGRIRKAVDLCVKNNLFDLSMLISQTNPDKRAAMVRESLEMWEKMNLLEAFPEDLKKIYNILAIREVDNEKSLNEIMEMCDWDWQVVLLYSALYSLELNSDITTLTNRFIHIALSCNWKELPQDINYLLISLYCALESPEFNSNHSVEEILNKMTDTLCVNLITSENKKNFSDSHIQYIVITILLNTLRETYNYTNVLGLGENVIYPQNYSLYIQKLKELHFKLLIKLNEEQLVLHETNPDFSNSWKYSASLISSSNVPKTIQRNMIRDILYKFTEFAKEDLMTKSNLFDPKISNNSLGLLFYSKFDFFSAYNYFKQAENFEKANEIFIFHMLSLRLLSNNISNEIRDELNNLAIDSVRSVDITWQKYGALFQDYINLIARLELGSSDEDFRDFNFISKLIPKVDAMTVVDSEDYKITYKLAINSCRNLMLLILRRMYNLRLKNKNMNMHFCITPNLNWMKDTNLSLELKRAEFISALDSLMQMESKSFSK